MLLIALVSILWATSVAFTTPDARLVVAYSSVAQLGFITLGIFSLRPRAPRERCCRWSTTRLVTAPLFFIVAALAARAGGSEMLRDMGGIAFRAPVLATLFLIVAFATLAIPGSSNFVGEFLILLGVFKSKLAIALIAFARRGRRRRLRAAGVHPLDAQPRRPGCHLTGDRACRRRWRSSRWCSSSSLLALYPQFGLKRTGADASRRTVAIVNTGRSPLDGEHGAVNVLIGHAPLAVTHIKGPHIDWAGLSPILALAVGALVVLLVGLLPGALRARASCRRPSP